MFHSLWASETNHRQWTLIGRDNETFPEARVAISNSWLGCDVAIRRPRTSSALCRSSVAPETFSDERKNEKRRTGCCNSTTCFFGDSRGWPSTTRAVTSIFWPEMTARPFGKVNRRRGLFSMKLLINSFNRRRRLIA